MGVLAALLTALSPAPALAYEMNGATLPLTDSEKQQIAEHIRRGGTHPSSCGPVCTSTWLEEHRPIPNQASSEQLRFELENARKASKALSRAKVLGVIGAAATAGELGWIIGTGTNRKWLKIGVPASGPTTSLTQPQFKWVARGSVPGPGIEDRIGTYMWSAPGGARYFDCPHADGCWVRTWYGYFAGSYNTKDRGPDPALNPPANQPACSGPDPPKPPGVQWAWTQINSAYSVYLSNGYQTVNCGVTGVTYGTDAAIQPTSPPEDYNGQDTSSPPSGGTRSTPGEADPGTGPSTTEAEKIGAAPTPGADGKPQHSYPFLHQWYGHQFRPNQFPDDPTTPEIETGAKTVPDCAGDSYAACVQRLRAAGFDGSVTRQDATLEAADLTKPADAVLALDPAAGSEVRSGAAFTITTNPGQDDMPVLVPRPGAEDAFNIFEASVIGTGLLALREDLPAPDYNYAPDQVVSVDPPGGTRVRRRSEVRVTTNPRDALDDQSDNRCESSAKEDPGTAPGSDKYTVKRRFTGRDPREASDQEIRLLWGDAGWGFRHIAMRHGWTSADDTLTERALRDTSPWPQTETAYRYYAMYVDSSTGARCTRKVVVEFKHESYAPLPKHIITSYSYEGWQVR